MGFLPPDYLDGNGQGHVNYSIRPKAALTTGALIAAQAFIIFDANDVLATNVATNTIDADRPWSALVPLSASSAVTQLLQWSAGDGAGPGLAKQTGNPGSGLRDVSIFVAENGDLAKGTPAKSIDLLMGQPRRVYDAPVKGILWGWEVSAYVVTKAVSAGARVSSTRMMW